MKRSQDIVAKTTADTRGTKKTEKVIRVERESFDAALKRLIKSGGMRASEIKHDSKKPKKIISPTR